MCQIHTQWLHFWRQWVIVDFDDILYTNGWLLDHIIIVIFIIGCAIGGLQKCPKFIRSGDTFGGNGLLAPKASEASWGLSIFVQGF